MVTDKRALDWAVREGIVRAGGSAEDPELFAKVMAELITVMNDPPVVPPPRARRESPTYPTIRVPVDRKAVLIAMTLLVSGDEQP